MNVAVEMLDRAVADALGLEAELNGVVALLDHAERFETDSQIAHAIILLRQAIAATESMRDLVDQACGRIRPPATDVPSEPRR
jgi:hypothetical protein